MWDRLKDKIKKGDIILTHNGTKNTANSFSDADKISSWATDAMNWATATGIISGKSNNMLDPQGTATRAEVATMVMRFLSK